MSSMSKDVCRYSLGGSMEVAQLLHALALADGVPTSQVCRMGWHSLFFSIIDQFLCILQLNMPGTSTSASFDDLLHQIMRAEGSL